MSPPHACIRKHFLWQTSKVPMNSPFLMPPSLTCVTYILFGIESTRTRLFHSNSQDGRAAVLYHPKTPSSTLMWLRYFALMIVNIKVSFWLSRKTRWLPSHCAISSLTCRASKIHAQSLHESSICASVKLGSQERGKVSCPKSTCSAKLHVVVYPNGFIHALSQMLDCATAY